METGTNGPAGAPALPVAPKAASSGPESAMALPTEGLSAKATGWKLETAFCSNAQVRLPSRGLGAGVEVEAHWGGTALGGWCRVEMGLEFRLQCQDASIGR